MKYFNVLLILLAAMEVSAQTDKGSWMIGGSMRVQRTYTSRTVYLGPNNTFPATLEGTYGKISASPNVGYFFAKNFVAALQVDYSYTWVFHTDNNHQRSLGIGPMVRYYIPFSKFAVFPEFAYSYGTIKNVRESIDIGVVTEKPTSNTFRGGIGMTWFVTNNIGIEGILAYQDAKLKKPAVGDTRDLYFNVGIQFYLPRKD